MTEERASEHGSIISNRVNKRTRVFVLFGPPHPYVCPGKRTGGRRQHFKITSGLGIDGTMKLTQNNAAIASASAFASAAAFTASFAALSAAALSAAFAASAAALPAAAFSSSV